MAVYQFGLHSAAEVEAQFGPPEYMDQEEWIIVPYRKNNRTTTMSIPKEDETNKTSNRFDALSDNESDNTTASTEEPEESLQHPSPQEVRRLPSAQAPLHPYQRGRSELSSQV